MQTAHITNKPNASRLDNLCRTGQMLHNCDPEQASQWPNVACVPRLQDCPEPVRPTGTLRYLAVRTEAVTGAVNVFGSFMKNPKHASAVRRYYKNPVKLLNGRPQQVRTQTRVSCALCPERAFVQVALLTVTGQSTRILSDTTKPNQRRTFSIVWQVTDGDRELIQVVISKPGRGHQVAAAILPVRHEDRGQRSGREIGGSEQA